MFNGASAFNQAIRDWNTSSVTKMSGMFEAAEAFNQSLSTWTLKSGVDLKNIFATSGMDAANLCKLKAKGGEWLKQWTSLGKTATCP